MSRGYFADISELRKHGGKVMTVITSLALLIFNVLHLCIFIELGLRNGELYFKTMWWIHVLCVDLIVLIVVIVFGQIAVANKVLIPAMAAVKFPNLDVSYPDGKTSKLPICSGADIVGVDKLAIPKASLLCLTFRAGSQVLIMHLKHNCCFSS